ncbi:DUF2280 domain-containing protein [Acinetobacter towneri]|uniref:DUF2280 domain-containing protein n=1 Tax=Acinetobacter towneri TaxID=202956 RepID=UPI00257694E1|nr:DUF2280 domain-containing protein [Acinetobacter towneri]MDM1282395.1 DUF2280 domain-containing protein [Acinetobacter towneri]MDM1734520.1 DUF2280 domain-containing protein [Acinetobacter towneri]
MAALKEPVKIFIVQSLACFETPQQVADAVKQRFGIEIQRQQCENYDPTKYSGRNLSKKLKDLFEKTRKDFKTNIEDIPVANKAFHFKELQKMYDDWGKNKVMKQNVLKQAQGLLQSGKSGGPSGLSEKEQIEIEMKRLELEKLKREVNPPETRPPEEDYKISLNPDEEIPNEPIL